MGEGEEVACLCPNVKTLQPRPRTRNRNIVVEFHSLETEVGTIFNPTVAEAVVAKRVAVVHAWKVSFLTFVTPAVHFCYLLVEEIAT